MPVTPTRELEPPVTTLIPYRTPPMPEELVRIAWCESNNRQLDANGKVVRGKTNRQDVGKYQINLSYWDDEAKKLNLDLFTEEDNESMALVLYERFGTTPWTKSKACWHNLDAKGIAEIQFP